MMKAYIVTARAGTSNQDRYIDSIWIIKASADKRRAALIAEFDRVGKNTTTDWRVWVTEAEFEDATMEHHAKQAKG